MDDARGRPASRNFKRAHFSFYICSKYSAICNIMYQATKQSERYAVITSYASGPSSVALTGGESKGIPSRRALSQSVSAEYLQERSLAPTVKGYRKRWTGFETPIT